MCGTCNKVWHHCVVHKNIHTWLVLEETELYIFTSKSRVCYKTNYITLVLIRSAIRKTPLFASFCIVAINAHVNVKPK